MNQPGLKIVGIGDDEDGPYVDVEIHSENGHVPQRARIGATFRADSTTETQMNLAHYDAEAMTQMGPIRRTFAKMKGTE